MATSNGIFRQTLACSSVVLNQFMIGIGLGWIGPTLLQLKSTDSPICNFDGNQASWIASINELGKLLGPFISPFLVDNLGRKYTLILLAIMYFSVNAVVIFARNIYLLYIARFTFGVANGINDVVAAIYIAENCSPSFRGIMASCVVLSFFGAVFVEYVLATFLSYVNAAIVNTIISSIVFVTLYFCTETPYFLVMKGQYKTAKKNLLWLRGDVSQTEVTDELSKIQLSVSEETQKEKFVERFKSAANVKAICVVIGISILGVATGGGIFITYPSEIFSSSKTLTVAHYSILYSVLQFIMVLISPFLIEKIDRRTLIVGSFFAMTCSNICSFGLVYLHARNYNVVIYPWLIFGSVAIYGIFCASMSTAGYAVKGEILPLSVRSIGSSIGVVSQSISSFCILKVFLPITNGYGMEANFLLYSLASLVATVFMYRVLPETRGKSLYEIQKSMKTKDIFDSIEEAEKMLNKKKVGDL